MPFSTIVFWMALISSCSALVKALFLLEAVSNISFILASPSVICFFLFSLTLLANPAETLWFDKPAKFFEETLMLLGDLTTIVFEMVTETKEPTLSAKEQFIKEIWQKRQELSRCKPEQKQFIQDELNEMKQEYLEYLEFQTEAKGNPKGGKR